MPDRKKTKWPSDRVQKLLGIELPLIQAPMAGNDSIELAVAVAQAGGLGSIACALLTPDDLRKTLTLLKAETQRPINLNFFAHKARVSTVYRQSLKAAHDNETVLTNVFSGRPARGILNRFVKELGPLAKDAPEFPSAGIAVGPLKAGSEVKQKSDFMRLWSGQSSQLCREMPASELIRWLADEALAALKAAAN